MKQLKKVGLTSVAAVMAATTLVGCGSTEGTDTATQGEKAELTLATWANEQEAKEIDAILEEISAASDEYTLKQQVIPKDYYVKVQTQIAGNQAPDLFWLAQEYTPAYMQNGAILSLDELLAEQTQVDMDDYYPSMIDTVEHDGSIYGLPWINQPYVVYYNKAVISEDQVKDWTWEDFQALSSQVKTDDMYGFASTGNPPAETFIWGWGGETFTPEGEIVLDSPEAKEGLQFMSDLMADPATMPFNEASSYGVEQAFADQKVAMMIGGATDGVERKVEEMGAPFEVGMAVMPAGPKEHVTFSWNAATVISSQTKHQEAAEQALLDLTVEMFDYKAPAPVASKADMIGEINPYKAYAQDIITESMEIARGFNNQTKQNELGGSMWDSLNLPILSNNDGKGNVDIDAIIDTTVENWTKIQ